MYDPYATIPLPEDEQSGGWQLPPAARHVLDVLALLDRPRNALASGAMSALQPGGDPLSGLYKGLTGQTDVHNADVIGIDRPNEKQDWPEWLGRQAAHLGGDMVGDPLNLVPLVNVAAKAGQLGKAGLLATKAGKEAAKYAGGTFIGKAFAHSPWGFTEEAVPIMDKVKRQSAIDEQAFMKKYKEVTPALDTLQEGDEGLIRYRQAMERPDIDPVAAGLDPKLFDTLKQMQAEAQELFTRRNEARAARGLPEIPQHTPDVDPTYDIMGRFRKKPGTFDEPLSRGPSSMFDPSDPARREIFGFDLPTGETAISKAEPKHLSKWGVKRDPATGEWFHEANGQRTPVIPKEVSLPEIIDSGIMGSKKEFVVNPAESLALESSQLRNQINFLDFLSEGEAKGLWSRLEDVPDGAKVRQIGVPGLEDLYAHPSLANWVENQATRMFDPNTSIGVIGDAARKLMNETRPGRALGATTQLWKQSTLPLHPGYHVGNAIGNVGLEYQAGLSPLSILTRGIEAGKSQLGKEFDVIPGLGSQRLVEELGVRDALGGWSGSEIGDALDKATRPVFLGGRLGEAGQFVADKARAASDWGYRQGAKIEDNARLSVAIDWLKKNAPNFAARSPEEQALLLDQAARRAKDAMIDYGPSGLTPFEQAAMKPIIPFYGWARGMAGQTADVALNDPARLARYGRFADAMSDPLTDQEKTLADPWLREAGAVKGLLGMPFGFDDKGNPRMMQLGRFIPQGNLEQAMKRPQDYLLGSVNPFIKTPFEFAANRSSFTGRDIDPIAGGGFEGLINPLIGRDYAKATSTVMGAQLPAAYAQLLSQLPGSRHLQEVNQLGRAAGLWEDPYKANQSFPEALLGYATGQKYYPFDEGKFTKNRAREWNKRNVDIRKSMQYAASKGDLEAADHYRQLMTKHIASKSLHLEAP